MTAALRTSLSSVFALTTLLAMPIPAIAQPTVTASIAPSPNRLGWNNTPVTISFACTGVKSCPEPIPVASEGAGQLFRQTVVDENGVTATASTAVNIDLTPATIAIVSPAADMRTTVLAVNVAADVDDALSGLARATCNGDPATVYGGRVTCLVPLSDGINDLVVQVNDRAGNSSSTGLQVHRVGRPSSITIVTAELGLLVGEAHELQVVDNFGRTLPDVEWSIERPFVAAVANDRKTIVGLSPGVTQVTATSATLSSSMTLRVLPGNEVPYSTTLWAVQKFSGYQLNEGLGSIHTRPAGADMPTMMAIEHEIAGSRLMIRALDETPRQLWIEAPAISPRERIGEQRAGDDLGTGLLRVETLDGQMTSIVRVGRPVPQTGHLWRYTPPGRLGEQFAEYDGVVDVVEADADGFSTLVGIDAMTGTATFRTPLPRSQFTASNVACIEGASARRERPADVGQSPTVLDDGVVNLAISRTDDQEDSLPCGATTLRSHRLVQLMQRSREGRVSYKTVFEYSGSSADRVDVKLGKVIPDGHDGQLVNWTASIGGRAVGHMMVRVIDGRLIPFELPALGDIIIAEEDMGVTCDGRTIVGFDVTTGQVLWTHRATPTGTLRMITAVGGGGLTVITERGIERIDRAGRRELLVADWR